MSTTLLDLVKKQSNFNYMYFIGKLHSIYSKLFRKQQLIEYTRPKNTLDIKFEPKTSFWINLYTFLGKATFDKFLIDTKITQESKCNYITSNTYSNISFDIDDTLVHVNSNIILNFDDDKLISSEDYVENENTEDFLEYFPFKKFIHEAHIYSGNCNVSYGNK